MSRIKLADISALTLYQDEYTSSKRGKSIPQLVCKGKPCKSFTPDVVRCVNLGGEGTDVDWKCETNLPESLLLGRVQVSCEGWSGPGDSHVLKGSCSLEYRLQEVPKVYRPDSHSHSSKGSFTSEALMCYLDALFIGILAFILYKLLYPRFEGRHRVSPPRTPRPDLLSNPRPDPSSNLRPDPSSNLRPDPSSNLRPDPSSNPRPDLLSNPRPDPSSNPRPDPSSNPCPDPSSNPRLDPSSNPRPDPSSNPRPDPSSNLRPDPSSNPRPDPSSNFRQGHDDPRSPSPPPYSMFPPDTDNATGSQVRDDQDDFGFWSSVALGGAVLGGLGAYLLTRQGESDQPQPRQYDQENERYLTRPDPVPVPRASGSSSQQQSWESREGWLKKRKRKKAEKDCRTSGL